ncbi:MAG TPA: phenylalanine--tRNA ligase subunit beta [Steroidobacteraceae bacterium]|nr:phenylalanine--tRNA ligase subunit beta [Steroidobacteraceae bacterium]
MKVSYRWLTEWVSVPWKARELADRLSMAGFEVESLEPAAPPFSGVVVAEILDAAPHPQADKLRVCRVATGPGGPGGPGSSAGQGGPGGGPLQIVCGASNARAGLKSALARVGAQLPGPTTIQATRIRGVESQGMLCSAKELGLAESSAGIVELPADAPLGKPLREYLELDDVVLDLNVTPNRGDALSVLGIARELSALSGLPLAGPRIEPVAARNTDLIRVHLDAPTACPKFAGRVIRGINNRAATPLWMRERLRRAGLRSISPVVDVTNYVMLELGQPLHAYDIARLRGDIRVRLAAASEPVQLLDGRRIELDPDVLVIADAEGAVGVAGIMGGERTAVSAGSVDVFLEVAYFAPEAIAGRARRLGLQTDASQRFERGVDPSAQERAMERATELIYEIAGGSPGAISVVRADEYLPRRLPVRLRRSQVARVLGAPVPPERIEAIFGALQMSVARTLEGWAVTPPAHRFDIAIEADLIEEIARIEGYGAFSEVDATFAQRFAPLLEETPREHTVLESFAARGWFEAVNYAFVDPTLQTRLFPDREALAIANPIASDLSVMRVSLWPGLVRAALENQRRQQDRIRLLEHGARFNIEGGQLTEIDSLAGIALGPRLPEQWGSGKEERAPVDFFDVKADVEALLAGTGDAKAFAFEAGEMACLHPGRTARIVRSVGEDGTLATPNAQSAQAPPTARAAVGWLGELHPRLVRELGFASAPILFEIDFASLRVELPRSSDVSRFPQVRRDIAVVVDEAVTSTALRERVTLTGSKLLREVRIFDVYRGGGVEEGRKSVALGLIFQENSRTLTDEDVDRAVTSIVADLTARLGARIRE